MSEFAVSIKICQVHVSYRYQHPFPRVSLADLERWWVGGRCGSIEFRNARGDRAFRSRGGWHFVRVDGGAVNASLRGVLDRLWAAEKNGGIRLKQPSPLYS